MPATDTPTRYLDEPAAAAYLGLSPRTLQVWRRTGDGPPYSRLSQRCIRYDTRTLDRWMVERIRTSTSDDGPDRAA